MLKKRLISTALVLLMLVSMIPLNFIPVSARVDAYKQICPKGGTTMAVTQSGTLFAWGSSAGGHLGNGTTAGVG